MICRASQRTRKSPPNPDPLKSTRDCRTRTTPSSPGPSAIALCVEWRAGSAVWCSLLFGRARSSRFSPRKLANSQTADDGFERPKMLRLDQEAAALSTSRHPTPDARLTVCLCFPGLREGQARPRKPAKQFPIGHAESPLSPAWPLFLAATAHRFTTPPFPCSRPPSKLLWNRHLGVQAKFISFQFLSSLRRTVAVGSSAEPARHGGPEHIISLIGSGQMAFYATVRALHLQAGLPGDNAASEDTLGLAGCYFAGPYPRPLPFRPVPAWEGRSEGTSGNPSTPTVTSHLILR